MSVPQACQVHTGKACRTGTRGIEKRLRPLVCHRHAGEGGIPLKDSNAHRAQYQQQEGDYQVQSLYSGCTDGKNACRPNATYAESATDDADGKE